MDKIQSTWNILPKSFIVKTTNKIIEEESENHVATKQALTYLYRVFRLLGLYRTRNYKYAYYFYSLLFNGFVSVFLPVSFVVTFAMQSSQTIDYGSVFTSIHGCMDCWGCSGKISILLLFIPKLLTAEKVMAKLDERCVSENEVALLVKLKKLGSKLVICYSILYLSYSISTYIASIMAGHPPYSIYLPLIDWRHSKWEFYVASFIELLLMSCACVQQVANDSYATVYVCILRTHMNILSLRVRKLCSNPEKTFEENFDELKRCIKDHKNLIELYKIIAPVISNTVFLQFTITAILLSIALIHILIFAPDFSSIAATCVYALAVAVETFPLCYFANCLIDDSKQLSNEIFHSSWIQQNSRYRKMLIFFIQRSQQTMELWAGKIFPINLNSFISIAKFSFSLYTLIKTMGLKERLGLE